jgi:hypothetical protein
MSSDLNTNSPNNGTKTERFEYEEATVLTLLQSYRSLTEQHNYEDAFAVANNCVHVAINTPDLNPKLILEARFRYALAAERMKNTIVAKNEYQEMIALSTLSLEGEYDFYSRACFRLGVLEFRDSNFGYAAEHLGAYRKFTSERNDSTYISSLILSSACAYMSSPAEDDSKDWAMEITSARKILARLNDINLDQAITTCEECINILKEKELTEITLAIHILLSNALEQKKRFDPERYTLHCLSECETLLKLGRIEPISNKLNSLSDFIQDTPRIETTLQISIRKDILALAKTVGNYQLALIQSEEIIELLQDPIDILEITLQRYILLRSCREQVEARQVLNELNSALRESLPETFFTAFQESNLDTLTQIQSTDHNEARKQLRLITIYTEIQCVALDDMMFNEKQAARALAIAGPLLLTYQCFNLTDRYGKVLLAKAQALWDSKSDTSEQVAEDLVNFKQSLVTNDPLRADITLRLAIYYLKTDRDQIGFNYFDEATQLIEGGDIPELSISVYTMVSAGEFFSHTKQYWAAIPYFEKAFQKLSATGSERSARGVWLARKLENLYSTLGKDSDADRFRDFLDSFHESE